jgi:tetratricopeptide (TPR) repeat protein
VIAAIVLANPAQRWEDFKDPGALAELPTSAASTEQAASAASAAGNGRYQWWSGAVDAWQGDPLTGIGAGNFALYWNAHPTLPVVVNDAHSLYVETLAELGPLGLLALLAFLGAAIAAGVGRRRSSRGDVAVWLGLVAAGAVSAAGEWTWELPAATAPMILAAAVLTGPATLRPRWPRPAEQGGAPERSNFGLGVATLLVGFASIWVAGVSLLSTIQIDESRDAVTRGELEEAATNATYASTLQPWSSAPKLQLAQVEELRGRLPEARQAAEEAIDRSPGDWRGWVVLARIMARDGDRAAAEEALARAGELSPLPVEVELPEPGE